MSIVRVPALTKAAPDARAAFDRPLCGFIILLLFVPAILWICHDRSVFPWDPAWYGEVSSDLYGALHRSYPQWAHALVNALPNRSPGLVWLGQFFVPLGSAANPAAGLLVCSLLLQLAGVYALFRTLTILFENHYAALGSVVFICSAPLFTGMTLSYFTEPFEGLGVTLFLLFLAGAPERPLLRSVVLLALAVLVAELGKISGFTYLVCPALVFLGFAAPRFRKVRGTFRIGIIDALLILAALAGWSIFGFWLLIHYQNVLHHVVNASSGPAADLYGTRAAFTVKMSLWIRHLGEAFWIPAVRPVLLAGVGWFIYLLARRRFRAAWADRVAAAALLQIVVILVVFSLNINEDSRFIFCLYPFVAIVLCWMITRIANRWATAAFCIVAFAQFSIISAEAHGILPRERGISPYLFAMDTEGTRLSYIRRAIENTCVASEDARLFVVGLELPYFNANTMSFYSSLAHSTEGLKCSYVNLGFAEAEPERAWQRILNTNPGALVFLKSAMSSITPSDPFNRVSAEIYQRAPSVYRLRPVAGAPDLALFEPPLTKVWRVRSGMFRDQLSVSTDVSGHSTWRVHPSRRAAAEATIIDYTAPLPRNAQLSGTIEQCDSRCPGVEIEIAVEGQTAKRKVVDVASPVAGRHFAIPLQNLDGQSISVRLQSLDARRDNIDFCWLTVRDVEIAAAR